jgi:hypothetical protein
MSFFDRFRKETVSNCPSCGAPLGGTKGGMCPYCASAISKEPVKEVKKRTSLVNVPEARTNGLNLKGKPNISVPESHRAPILVGRSVRVGGYSQVSVIVGEDVKLGKNVDTEVVLSEGGIEGKGDLYGIRHMQGTDIKLGEYSHVDRMVFEPRNRLESVKLGKNSSVNELLVVGRENYYPKCGEGVSVGQVRNITAETAKEMRQKFQDKLSKIRE